MKEILMLRRKLKDVNRAIKEIRNERRDLLEQYRSYMRLKSELKHSINSLTRQGEPE